MEPSISESEFTNSSAPLTPEEKWLFRLGLLCFLSIPVALCIPHPAGPAYVLFMIAYQYGPKVNGARKSWLGVWTRWLFLGFRPYRPRLRELRGPLIGLYVTVILGGAMMFAFGGGRQGPYASFRFFQMFLDELGIYLSVLAVGAYEFRKKLFPGLSDRTVKVGVMVVMLVGLVLILKSRL